MSDIQMTCDETPLAWPSTVAVTDLKLCTSCGVQVIGPASSALQALTRRQGGGVGDGVNITENPGIGADFRGQRYTFEEAIFHTPGLHVFPGQTEVYPAEYHIHMRTLAEPLRAITIVIPVSHMVTGPGQDYFAAIVDQPSGAANPPLTDLLVPGTQVIEYQGPDIRGRTADVPAPESNCSATSERQFLMVLTVAQIRATDLERIPRIGSLSTDPRDLPANGVTPAVTQVLRNRILQNTVLASPGILGSSSSPDSSSVSSSGVGTPGSTTEVECNPIKVINGNDIVVINGTPVNIQTALGLSGSYPSDNDNSDSPMVNFDYISALVFFIGTFGGLVIADYITTRLFWNFIFDSSNTKYYEWMPIKIILFVAIALGSGIGSSSILSALGL
jgi:hypothetical protein